VQILDLGISGDATYRNDSAFHTGIEGNFGTGSMIQNVWIEHTKVGMWPDTGTNGLYIGASRIRTRWPTDQHSRRRGQHRVHPVGGAQHR